ncbi:hypothetical protein K6119_18930 [Paracrocinitomix mangrovi]|uniref:hypothetical protein n=1 Tax=Paracrocinitomix mangrovi TaxID=2862509 RepID=UPI001C8DD9FD|nr:hypothetical protein [Paracrocinitomix mangrovi]UKN01800.1 hypothetical protein K6119_18930 [Paracrocinitomix mangrovi]
MSKFKTRLKYYLIGFGLGLVLMFFFFGNRACSWLPENRVKNMLAEKEIVVGDSVLAIMDCQGVNNEDVYRFLNDDGDVKFGKSDTKVEPKEYHIEGIKNNEDLVIRYALNTEFTEVIGIEYNQTNCSTTLSNEHKNVVALPQIEVIKNLELQEFRILDEAKCQLDCLNITEESILTFHHNANYNAEESQPRLQPSPHYIMEGELNGLQLKVLYILGESRTRIADVQTLSVSCECE